MSDKPKYKRYIWELPVRWNHWVNVMCIVTLSVTGFLIGTRFSIGYSTSGYAKGRRKLIGMLRYYLFLDKDVPETIGHNPLATTIYTTLFYLYIAMILTGFALYALHAPGGPMFKALGFMYHLFSNQGMRLFHHIGMWFVFGFLVNHIYSAWLMDIKEHGSEISSMFSGYKFTVKKED